MERSEIISDVIFNEMIMDLNRYEYEVINRFDDKEYTYFKINKSTNEHNFELFVKYNHVTNIIELEVFCLTPVPDNKLIFCLKLLNYCAVFEKGTSYNLCPKRHIMMCKTYHSILTWKISLGKALISDSDCSIDNLEMINWTIEHNDLQYFIHNIHPIIFHKYFY